jgi:signal transduction histidine kinase
VILRPSRPALLFLAALGAPCILLIGLTLRLLAQERELAEKRHADDRRRLATDIRQDLIARVTRLRVDLLERHAGADVDGKSGPPLAFVARVNGDALVFPWDADTAAAKPDQSSAFIDAIRSGEHDEFIQRSYADAAISYAAAARAASTPTQRAVAQLQLARVLEKDEQSERAHSAYVTLAQTPSDAVDDQRIPLGLYAARRLIDSQHLIAGDVTAVADVLRTVLREGSALNPTAVYMAREVASALVERATDAGLHATAMTLRDQTNNFAEYTEQMLALQSAFPAIIARARAVSASDEVVWVPFGQSDATWLVGVARQEPVVTGLRLAPLVDSIQAANRRGAAVVVSSEGEPLGDPFPGLSLRFDPAAVIDEQPLQRSVLVSVLLLVVGVTLAGGYLFWRDTRREMRLAAMRAQFVSSVSHELRTPLTAIRMFAETLLLGRVPKHDSRDDYLQTIVSESERLTRLLDNVLDFAKIEAGRKTYHLRPCSPADVVRSAASTMGDLLARNGFHLEIVIDEAMPLVLADRDALEQALLNLLSNAVKYSGRGRKIELSVRSRDGRVVIDVADAGIGIPPAEQSRIWEKFYRVNDPEHASIPGTGLGLTLVAHVVAAHHGDIQVQSEVGRGTTFSIGLPAASADDAVSVEAGALA